jgi:hypothetical protein
MSKVISGELRIWTDGKQAHACIDAETSSGPVLFQASVPLALVRAKVLRSLARRGYPVARGGRKTEVLVGFFGRRLALRRLARAVPRAFVPGGLATHLSLRRFAGRRLPGLPGRLLLAPERFSPSARLLPAASPVALATDEPIEGVGYRELVGVAPVAVAAVTATPKIMAGAKLLSAAATSPKALAQVKRITSLAKAGNPAGKAALNTLKKANIFRKRKRAAAAVATAVPASAALALRSPTARSVTPSPSVPPPPRTKKRRRFFANWQRGVE